MILEVYDRALKAWGKCFAGYCVDRMIAQNLKEVSEKKMLFMYWDYQKQMKGKPALRGEMFEHAKRFIPDKPQLSDFERAVIGQACEDFKRAEDADFEAWVTAARNQKGRVFYRRYEGIKPKRQKEIRDRPEGIIRNPKSMRGPADHNAWKKNG